MIKKSAVETPQHPQHPQNDSSNGCFSDQTAESDAIQECHQAAVGWVDQGAARMAAYDAKIERQRAIRAEFAEARRIGKTRRHANRLRQIAEHDRTKEQK